MSENRSTSTATAGGGIGFFGLLTVVLFALKVTGHLDWSWFWVFSPLMVSFALFLTILAFVVVVSIIVLVVRNGSKR